MKQFNVFSFVFEAAEAKLIVDAAQKESENQSDATDEPTEAKDDAKADEAKGDANGAKKGSIPNPTDSQPLALPQAQKQRASLNPTQQKTKGKWQR